MSRKPLNILVVRDGRPGHEKQSMGIVKALGRRFAITLETYDVNPGYRALFNAVSIGKNASLGKLATFRPDLIIGAGAHTHLVILALKQRLGGRTVVCMKPSWCIRSRFDLCCIPRHDEIPEGGNILLTDGPPNVNTNEFRHQPQTALVLVGGVDEKSHRWDNQSVSQAIANVISSNPDFDWSLTTSPRTPQNFLDIFNANKPKDEVHIFPFSTTGPGWLEERLQSVQWVVVTEDSLSMIFEALSAGCLVVTLPVQFNKKNKFTRCLADLKQRQLVGAAIDPNSVDASATLDEASRCADHVERLQWWAGE